MMEMTEGIVTCPECHVSQHALVIRRGGEHMKCKACGYEFWAMTIGQTEQKRRERARRYYSEHREEIREKYQRYYAEHRDEVCARMRSYRARMMAKERASRPTRHCPVCGFEIVGRTDKVYCSDHCYKQAWAEAHREEIREKKRAQYASMTSEQKAERNRAKRIKRKAKRGAS